MPTSTVPNGKCIVTCFTADGQRCWYIVEVLGSKTRISGDLAIGPREPPMEVADQLASLGARIAWYCYGPPTERLARTIHDDAREGILRPVRAPTRATCAVHRDRRRLGRPEIRFEGAFETVFGRAAEVWTDP